MSLGCCHATDAGEGSPRIGVTSSFVPCPNSLFGVGTAAGLVRGGDTVATPHGVAAEAQAQPRSHGVTP